MEVYLCFLARSEDKNVLRNLHGGHFVAVYMHWYQPYKMTILIMGLKTIYPQKKFLA